MRVVRADDDTVERLVTNAWRTGLVSQQPALPSIVLSFLPMSHMMGRGTVYRALAHGGTVYFAAKSDLSTLLEDIALVRPTQMTFVPRVWEMIHQEVQSEVDRRNRRVRHREGEAVLSHVERGRGPACRYDHQCASCRDIAGRPAVASCRVSRLARE